MLVASALLCRQRFPCEGRDFTFRKAGLFEECNRVLAQGRHPLSRGDIGSGHTERQVQNPESAAAIPDLGQCAAMGNLRIA